LRSLHGCFLNQQSVEFSFLYTTRSSLDLTFKQYGDYLFSAAIGTLAVGGY
jgi:hypothetical protein